VATLLARVVLGPRQRGVLGHVSDDLGQFVHFVRDLVDVDAAVVGFLLVITIPALREGECGGEGVMERSGKRLEGKAGSSLEGMTRRAECGSPCPPWGKACCYCGREKSEVSPGAITCFPYTLAGPGSPFLAESNTHETRLVGTVWFHSYALPAKQAFRTCSAARPVAGRVKPSRFAKGGAELRTLPPWGFVLGSAPRFD